MEKYLCSVCGYVYDEAAGIPESGIAPGTAWNALPDDWICPICGASKSEFEKLGGAEAVAERIQVSAKAEPSDMREISSMEISALCTNLARGCEKQYKPQEAAMFRELSGYFKAAAAPAKEPCIDNLIALIEKDLEDYPGAHSVASEVKDRGALRALVWTEKVTRILKSLLTRYQKEGEAMIENTGVYVCTICGFIYVGDNLPEVCPVCKVPNWKFEKVEGGNENG